MTAGSIVCSTQEMPKKNTKTAKHTVHVRLDAALYELAKREAGELYIDMTSFFTLAVKDKVDTCRAARGAEG